MPRFERDGITLEFDHEPSDEELDEAFKFESNFAASEKHVKPDQGVMGDIGDMLGGAGLQGLDIAKSIQGNLGGLQMILDAPEMIEGQMNRSASNMQQFQNPILQNFAAIPMIGDTMTNAWGRDSTPESAGRAIFDVGSLLTPAGVKGAKAGANAAGRSIRPAPGLGSLPSSIPSRALETIGTAAGAMVHRPAGGARIGRMLSGSLDAGRGKLADILDPSGSSAGILKSNLAESARLAGQERRPVPMRVEPEVENINPYAAEEAAELAKQQRIQAQRPYESPMEVEPLPPPEIYDGTPIQLPVAEGTTKPIHRSILSQQDPQAFLKEQLEPPPIPTPDEQWAIQRIEEEAGGRPLIPEPIEPLAPALEANPAPYANTPTGAVRDIGGAEGAFARIAQAQAVATAERQARIAQRKLEKLLSGKSGPKVDELVLPENAEELTLSGDRPPVNWNGPSYGTSDNLPGPGTRPENPYPPPNSSFDSTLTPERIKELSDVDPLTVIDDAPVEYISAPTDMPGIPNRTPGEQHLADIAFREQLMAEEAARKPSEALTVNLPETPGLLKDKPVEKFGELEKGSDQTTTAGGKLVQKGQGKLKGMEAEQAESNNLSNVSPYKLGDLAPNATRHKLKNQRMKGTSTRQVRAKEVAEEICKSPDDFDEIFSGMSDREKAYYNRFYTDKGKRRKNPLPGKQNKFEDDSGPKVNDSLYQIVESHIISLGVRLKELRPTANAVKGFKKLTEDAYGKATGKYGEGEAHLDFDQIRANAESSVDSRGLKGEQRSKAIAQDIAIKSINATLHEAAHGPSKGHGKDFDARVDDLRESLGPGEYEKLVRELRDKIMKSYQ